MDPSEMRQRVRDARVGRLATVTPEGDPHAVPVCFAFRGNDIVSIVDDKPKSTTALRRLDNVRAHSVVSLLVDHYDDDWRRLWWVRVDGTARVVESEPDAAGAVAALAAKYDQYRIDPPSGPVLVIEPARWRAWSASS
jgi:PPOX class probable F420-dependent enzyme